MIAIVILNAFISTIAQYIDKHLVGKCGITRKDYFYYIVFIHDTICSDYGCNRNDKWKCKI